MLKIQMVDGIPEINAEDLYPHLPKVFLVDVRRPDEFTGELGHIAGAKLSTLGPELIDYLQTLDKNQEIVFVCRSGGRSGQVAYSRLCRASALHSRVSRLCLPLYTGGIIATVINSIPHVKI